MMSVVLRVELLLFALIFFVLVFRSVSKKKLQLRYSLIWLLVAFCMVAAACFPGIIELISNLVGIQVPSNLIYFLGIVVLLVLSYSLSIIVSKQSDQIKHLTQYIAIETYLSDKKFEALQAQIDGSDLTGEKT